MKKLSLLFCGLVALACNNQASTTSSKDTTATSATTGVASKAPLTDDAMQFLSTCVDNAKALHGEQGAYSLCKCLYGQVQQKYPGADSATLLTHLNDTAEVAQMVQKCK